MKPTDDIMSAISCFGFETRSGSSWTKSTHESSAAVGETSHSTYTERISFGKPSTRSAAIERISVDLPAPLGPIRP